VIDDAIVVVENIVLHRDAGESRADAIRDALLEIRGPLIGSTITPIVVFLPLITLPASRDVFSRAGDYSGYGASDLVAAGAHLDANPESLPVAQCAESSQAKS